MRKYKIAKREPTDDPVQPLLKSIYGRSSNG